ncbi:MAG TPA: hypothetical protein VJ732_16505 [Bryobacteraceae bacterium]|nr:hypothetical protein [Bryobacteraceae bacterium]
MSIDKTRAPRWELSIYVTNAMARSSLAVGNLRRLCDERIPARYRIRVVDLSKYPQRSRRD